ncbi:WG repeat-containing protein [Anaerotignum faecicola]|nr:WG repeat-containing protein [Anaerotignum faecicola]
MKKIFCMALSAALLAGSVPAYAAEESLFTKTPHTFTARVGTTEFTKDGTAQPLDVPIYIKDSYVMLPLRTFMKALYADAELVWEDGIQLAKVTMQDYTLSFDITGNRIWRNSSLLPSFGQMEVKDGRVFVPLRDWEGVLQGNSRYIVDADALRWDAETKTAAVQLTELTAATENDTSSIKGTGEAAVFGIPLTDRYDYIESIGGDYFIAEKYVNTAGDILGAPQEYEKQQADWFVLNQQGKVLLQYSNKDVLRLRGFGDGFLRLDKRDGTNMILDMEGNTQFTYSYDDYHDVGSFSEGLARAMNYEEGKCGYVNTKGEEVIPFSFYTADAFSEGLAAVGVELSQAEGEIRYGYIDKAGNWVVEPKYRRAFAFQDGLAKVEDTDRNIGYIDKTGKEVIPLRYREITDFRNGKAFAQEKSGEVILIDTTGKKLKSIITGKYMREHGNGIISIEAEEQVAPGRVEYVRLYFDENGRVSEKDAEWRMRLSEGLAPYQDEKTGKYGYVGEDGTWVIAPTFDFARDFEDGYAVVSKKVTLANGKEDVQWGTVCHPI